MEEFRGQEKELLRNICKRYFISKDEMQGFIDISEKVNHFRSIKQLLDNIIIILIILTSFISQIL